MVCEGPDNLINEIFIKINMEKGTDNK